MVELPKSEEELNSLIEEKVKAKVEELTAKHNNDMAGLRKSYDEKIRKTQEQANMSAEEKAKQLAEEKEKETQQELADLRAFKKSSVLKERLAKENLPTYFANDNRLLNAEEGELDKVIKVVKGEYEASLPKGATHSTVVNTAGNNTPAPKDNKGVNEFAQALENALK